MDFYLVPSSISFHSPLSLLKKNSHYSNRSRGRWCCSNDASHSREPSAFSYRKLVQFSLDEIKSHTPLIPFASQENFHSLMAMDGKTKLQMLSFKASKVRFLRSLSIEGSDGMQVLDFAVFPKPEFDFPIFCANFFTAASTNIVVLDLNPLHDVINKSAYKEKYYRNLLPLGLKYTQAWLQLMDQAAKERDSSRIACNREAQHRYLTWRSEKDPGHRLLRKLIGETHAEDVVKNFLFHGVNELGNKTFLDYFPEYRSGDGTISEKRSMIGKSFEYRPWNTDGEFIGDKF